METISIKSISPEKAIPLLTNALNREKRIIIDTLNNTRGKITQLAETLSVDTEKLMRGEVTHSDTDDMRLIELEGEIEIFRHLEGELKELEALEICR